MNRYAAIVGTAVVALLACGLLLRQRPRSDWRHISTQFIGTTNNLAIIRIQNPSSTAIHLREDYFLEYIGIAPPAGSRGLKNLTETKPTPTNLNIGGKAQADLYLPLPKQGTSWIARLQFTPASDLRKVNESLIRSTNSLVKSLPVQIAGVPVRGVPVQFVQQPFSVRE